MPKTVVVIGAGSSGLAAIKSCLEVGLNVTAYEATGKVGGLWNYVDGDCSDRGTVFRGLVANSSRDLTSYSDFIHSEKSPLYLPHTLFAEYFHSYAEHFHLLERIKFNHKVLQVDKTDDHEITGRWKLRLKDLKTENVFDETYDFVIVSTGHHTYPSIPKFPGQDEFQGQQLHSHQYRKPETFQDQRVLVVGFGNSSCDIAAECATTAKEVRLSTRKKGGWILPRTIKNGRPTDEVIGVRCDSVIYDHLPMPWISSIYEKLANDKWDHELYGLKPKHRLLDHFPVINDRLPMEILFGKVKVVGGLQRLTKNGAILEDTDQEIPTDVVIYATGFRSLFPFLKNVIDVERESQTFYKYIWPTKFTKNTFAFVGLIDSDGRGTITLAEAQARWVAQVFVGNLSLPPVEKMNKANQKETEGRLKQLGEEEGKRLHLFVHSTPYTDEVCSFIGAKPNLFKLFFTDPKLFWACFTGPFLCTQFRLNGPHPWEGARDAILGYEKRLRAITKREDKKEDNEIRKKRRKKGVLPRFGFLVTVSVIGYFAFKKYGKGTDFDLNYLTPLLNKCNIKF